MAPKKKMKKTKKRAAVEAAAEAAAAEAAAERFDSNAKRICHGLAEVRQGCGWGRGRGWGGDGSADGLAGGILQEGFPMQWVSLYTGFPCTMDCNLYGSSLI